MPAVDGDDYGLSSSDEADLLAMENSFHHGTKRTIYGEQSVPPAKRAAIDHAANALERFGLKDFRLKQAQVISRILNGGSATVVFPTGGGKSLCYQIPALVFSELDDSSGITLVVSPLLALMKDQVDGLAGRGIKAATMDSSKSREDYMETCKMLRNRELNLLYCAPERLNNEGFVDQMKNIRGGIRLLAVDEAHCISEWGHAFRPDYLKIARFVQEINAKQVICLTATATPRVAQDICKAFGIDDGGLFRASTYRSNLELLAESAKTKQDLYPRLFRFLENHPGPTIIYVTLQKQTEALATDLRHQGFRAKAFHAGMEASVKIQLQNEFMRLDNLIIVATIAFGMGVDKANILNVVHFSIPNSLESYSQEIGRAGRDGKPSHCMFYVCGEDVHLRDMFARGDLPSRGSVRLLLQDIFHPIHTALDPGKELKFSHSTQEKDYDIRSTTLKNIFAQLELTHNLIRASTPIYTKYSYKMGSNHELMKSHISSATSAIKKYSSKAKVLYHIDVEEASRKAKVDRTDIIRKLNELNETGAIELKAGGVMNVYKIIQPLPKNNSEVERLVESIYSLLEKREEESLERASKVLNLVTGTSCFSRALTQHFGDDLPNGKRECGHCSWCMTHRAIILDTPPPVLFNQSAFRAVLSQVPYRDDARLLARIAFGITSPRVMSLKLSKEPIFGSMADHDFMDLLDAFTLECNKASHGS